MNETPRSLSVKDLLNRAFDQMTSKVPDDETETAEPYDCEGMDIIASADCLNPLLMIVGQDYQQWVLRHAYFYASKQGKKTAFVCFNATPLHYLVGLLVLSSGIPEEDLRAFKVSPHFFETFNEACSELHTANLCFYEMKDFVDFPRFVEDRIEDGVEVLVIDAMNAITISGKPANQIRRQYISFVLQSIAHDEAMTIVAGCKDDDRFPGFFSDSTFHCDP